MNSKFNLATIQISSTRPKNDKNLLTVIIVKTYRWKTQSNLLNDSMHNFGSYWTVITKDYNLWIKNVMNLEHSLHIRSFLQQIMSLTPLGFGLLRRLGLQVPRLRHLQWYPDTDGFLIRKTAQIPSKKNIHVDIEKGTWLNTCEIYIYIYDNLCCIYMYIIIYMFWIVLIHIFVHVRLFLARISMVHNLPDAHEYAMGP